MYHKNLIKSFEKGNSSSKYIQDIVKKLKLSKDNNASIYQSAFVVLVGDVSVGYLY